MSGQVSRGSVGEYQAYELAGVAGHLNQDIANSLGKIQRIELVFY